MVPLFQSHPVRVLDSLFIYFFLLVEYGFQRHLQGTHWNFGWLCSVLDFHQTCDMEAFVAVSLLVLRALTETC